MTSSEYTVSAFVLARDTSVNTAYMDFNNAVSHNPDALFVFYEGYDSDYYYTRLQTYAQYDIETIKCKGKQKVIGVYNLLLTKPEYNKYRKGFFVDKDFDLNTDPIFENFYVTSSYSVENYYLSEKCIENFMKNMFNFHSGDPELESIISDYCSMRQKYFEAILLFNSWYCAIRRKYKDSIKDISLDKDMPKGFLKIDFTTNDVQSLYSLEKIEEEFSSAKIYTITQDELESAQTYLREDLLMNLRGKYCLSFLVKYIANLIEIFKNVPKYKKYKRNINIQDNNIMSIMSIFADTDPKLIKYIEKLTA